jgi:hypothetical protein
LDVSKKNNFTRRRVKNGWLIKTLKSLAIVKKNGVFSVLMKFRGVLLA